MGRSKGMRYSPEFKEKALKLAAKIGNGPAAKQLDITGQTLRNWQNKVIISMAEPQKEPVKAKPSPPPTATKQEYHRGEIYYVREFPVVGSEQKAGRPAVIISNEQLNKNLRTVTIAWLTTKILHTGPEYTLIKSSGCTSRVLGSQITTIDKTRIGEYIGKVTPDEMKAINKCIFAALQLECNDDEIITRITGIKAERDAYRDMYDKLFERFMLEAKKTK